MKAVLGEAPQRIVFPGSQPVSLARSNLDLLRDREYLVGLSVRSTRPFHRQCLVGPAYLIRPSIASGMRCRLSACRSACLLVCPSCCASETDCTCFCPSILLRCRPCVGWSCLCLPGMHASDSASSLPGLALAASLVQVWWNAGAVQCTMRLLVTFVQVSWKADGTRYMMLLALGGVYLIDRAFRVRRVQMRFPTDFRSTPGATHICGYPSVL
jgi:mRNA capping enzyme, catalytic domain